jgi:hypothetical protein
MPKPTTPGDARPRGSDAQAERERKAQAQHDAWTAKADAIAAQLGVRPVVKSDVDFRIAYAKTFRRVGTEPTT